ncbi:NUDIX domain-containing protein [Candidatus Woesearchaeota archaeon]|nr:NUDIX domain-containing protein [Candidatus Woesearchaeota archaeon]
MRTRRKGVAIVETSKGILLVSGRSRVFALPGGGADKDETRKHAAMRELREETGLYSKNRKYLFSYVGRKWHTRRGSVKNHAKIFLIKTYGRVRPRHEIKHIAYWKPGSRLRISGRTKWILDKYLKEKR